MSDIGPTHQMIDGVAVLTLRQHNRPVIVLDWALLRAIDAAMDRVEKAPLKGFVLASESRVFVAGADLKEIVSLDEQQLDEYLSYGQHVFGRISRLACPSVAALNGAALGGGLEIAMHCDVLIAAQPAASTPDKPAKPYQIGLPEAGLSICPGWGGTNMLPARMDPARAIEMTALGKPFTVFDAVEAGLIAALVSPDELIQRAVTRVRSMRPRGTGRPRCVSDPEVKANVQRGLDQVRGTLPASDAAQAVAQCVAVGLRDGWAAALEMERRELNRLRYTQAGKAAIEAFFARSAAKA